MDATLPFTIEADERQILLDVARSLNERADRLDWDKPANNSTTRPGDLFNDRASWDEILEPAGWVAVMRRGDTVYWRRPGKDDKTWSATSGHCKDEKGRPLLYVFSSNAAPFEMGKSYSPFAAYTVLHHAGDYKAAARALAGKGYSTGPAPKRNGTNDHAQPAAAPEPEPWPEPIPLTDGVAAEPFPLRALPPPLVHFVEASAWAKNCPVDYVTLPLLVIAGSAIGSTRCLEVKRGWRERACLYGAVIAPPGGAKSPALMGVASPVYKEQTIRIAQYKEAKVLWDDNPGNRPAPQLDTVYVNDVTVEKIAELLQKNPRGLVMIRDELSAWIAGMDQYKSGGKGSDRQFYLSTWAGEPAKIDRKYQDVPIFVPYPFLGIVGGIPPDLLNRLRGEHDLLDGFFDRILFAYPTPMRASGETWRQVDEQTEAIWAATLSRLWAIEAPVGKDGGIRPWYVRLTSCGRQVWERITAELAGELNRDDLSDAVKGSISKLRIYCVRLALIIHQLRIACGEAIDEDVDGESMERAASLVRYFMSHALKVHGALGTDWRLPRAERLLRWAKDEGKTTFRRRDAYRAIRYSLNRVEDIDAILDLLVQHGHVRKSDAPRIGNDRKSETYEVNPLLQDTGQSGQSGQNAVRLA